MGLVCLPRFLVDVYGKCIDILYMDGMGNVNVATSDFD